MLECIFQTKFIFFKLIINLLFYSYLAWQIEGMQGVEGAAPSA